MRRSIVLACILILTASSLLMAKPTLAQTKPSVPEFTLKFIDDSHDVPPRHEINQFTGKDVTVEAGYHVQNMKIEVAIRNQPFNSYNDADGNSVSLFYSVRMKGHFGDSWVYPSYGYYYVKEEADNYVGADRASDYTVITYGLVGNNGTEDLLCLDISDDGQADFQVRAFIGYNNRTSYMTTLGEGHLDVFLGETSGWSNKQTITIPTAPSASSSDSPPLSPSPSSPTNTSSPSPTQQPTQSAVPTIAPTRGSDPLLLSLGIVAVVVAVAAIAISIAGYFRKAKS